MKQLSSIIFLATLLFFTSCDNIVEDGIDRDPIIIGKRNFHVGAEGGEIETQIIKSFFWYIGNDRETSTDTVKFWYKKQIEDTFVNYDRFDTIVFENLKLWTEGKRLKAELRPNDLNMEKRFNFGLQKGNRHEGLYITQEGKKD